MTGRASATAREEPVMARGMRIGHHIALVAVMLATASAPVLAQTSAKPPKRPKLELQRDSNDWRSYQISGVELMDVKPKQARTYFEWAARLDPARPEPHFALAIVAKRDEPMRLALERDPFMHVGRIRAFRMEGGEPRHIFGLRDVGWFDLASGQPDSARAHFHEAMRRWPKDRTLLWGLVLAHYDAGQIDSADLAIARQREALKGELARENGMAVHSLAFFDYMIGRAYGGAKRFENARAAYERALAEDLSYHPAHVGLALVAVAEQDTATALAQWDMAVSLIPDEASYRVAYAVLLSRTGRHADAAVQGRAAVEAAPYYSAARLALARALDGAGEGAAAAAAYREYILRAPVVDAAAIATALERISVLAP
jgi:Tfp pilus assembly protein PilF